MPLQFSIGDSISLIDFSNPKNTREMTVGGFLKQSSYIFSPGVWMNGEVVVEQFGGEMTRMYVSVAPDALPSVDHKRQDLPAQGKSTEVREAASELEAVLDVELASENVNVQTVAEEISIIQSLVLAILSLFEGYLALGLLVGVAGIGVVTVRNVSERRATIGMLRAVSSATRASTFSLKFLVALLGMLNGFVIGYGFHVVLYKAVWEAEGAVFSFPCRWHVGAVPPRLAHRAHHHVHSCSSSLQNSSSAALRSGVIISVAPLFNSLTKKLHHLLSQSAVESPKNRRKTPKMTFFSLTHPAHSINTTHGVGRDTEPSGV